MVLTGAGVSCSCGIPDFRSSNGIYNRLQEYQLPTPQDMFDIEYFKTNPHPFFRFSRELLPGNYEPSRSHYFIKALEDKGECIKGCASFIV